MVRLVRFDQLTLLFVAIFCLFQQAQVYFSGQSRYLGVFEDNAEAALAYNMVYEELRTLPRIAHLSREESAALVEKARARAIKAVDEKRLKEEKEPGKNYNGGRL